MSDASDICERVMMHFTVVLFLDRFLSGTALCHLFVCGEGTLGDRACESIEERAGRKDGADLGAMYVVQCKLVWAGCISQVCT